MLGRMKFTNGGTCSSTANKSKGHPSALCLRMLKCSCDTNTPSDAAVTAVQIHHTPTEVLSLQGPQRLKARRSISSYLLAEFLKKAGKADAK